MKCYYDPTQDAVGLCKSCQKGLSSAFAVDMGKGLACKGRCEADVASLIALIDRNMAVSNASNQILKRHSGTRYGASAFMALIGAVFIIQGILNRSISFTIYLGVLFFVYGMWNLYRAARYAKIVESLPDQSKQSK